MAEYIERDALIKTTRETPFTMSMCLTVEECKGMNEAREILADIFEILPAADVAPVRHGEWWYTPTHWAYCSICGAYPPEETNAITPYCPNCGAKMDGGENE